MPIYPISFSIHESKIVDKVSDKTQLMSITQAKSGLNHTPVYYDEQTYYNNYRNSCFAKSCKKAGWDCMRHYEILANGCIPNFVDIDKCPKNTLTYFPKDLIKEGNELINNSQGDYKTLVTKLLNYTKEHLTTKSAAKNLLNYFPNSTISSVLVLTNNGREDFLYNSLLTGLKELLGEKCIDYPAVSHIYKGYSGSFNHFHGKGFTISRLLPDEYNINCNRNNIEERIANKEFSLIINTYDCYELNESVQKLMNHVNQYYKPEEVVYICGKDCEVIHLDSNPQLITFYDKHECPFKKLSNDGFNIFIRELGDD
jgi:hypothetical protein